MAFRRFGFWPRLLTLVVLAAVAAMSVALSLVVHDIVNDQQSRLLREHTKEAAALISTLFDSVESSLPVLASATHPEPGATGAFTAAARPLLGDRSSAIGALLVARGAGDTQGTASVLAAVGQSPPAGSQLEGPQAALAVRAFDSKGMVSQVLVNGSNRYLELALRAGRVVMYEDVPVRSAASAAHDTNAPFSELDGALYASPAPAAATLVLATTAALPLSGTVDRLPVQVGVDRWLLVTRSKGPLVGSFAAGAPWLVLAAGLVAGLLTATLVETLARRKDYAQALIEDRTRALRSATELAEKANQSKSEFLSRMSHELRTPLNAVLGFAQLLELDDLEPSHRESVAQIVKGGRHLLNLINEVLDISRIDTGTLALSVEPVLACELIEETLDLVRPLAEAGHVEVTLSDPSTCGAYVLADRQRLKQILLNLLSNAIKYNREGGSVVVSGRTAAEVGRFRITVSDTGRGIRAEDMDRLFVPFDRLGAERSEIEGTGVGLALSRRLAEAMGGTVDAQSTYGEGSRFSVQLPTADESRLAAGDRTTDPDDAPTSPGGVLPRHTVLYIEDNPSNVRLVERLLARRGDVEVVAAAQGRLGLELARQHRPEVILLDLHLPDIGGHEVLRQLRADPRTEATPVVVVSADATKGQIDRLMAAGAHGYLTKPLDLRQLVDTLEGALVQRATPEDPSPAPVGAGRASPGAAPGSGTAGRATNRQTA